MVFSSRKSILSLQIFEAGHLKLYVTLKLFLVLYQIVLLLKKERCYVKQDKYKKLIKPKELLFGFVKIDSQEPSSSQNQDWIKEYQKNVHCKLLAKLRQVDKQEMIHISRNYRVILYLSKILKGKQNKYLFLEIASGFEGSDQRCTSKGKPSNLSKRRLEIFRFGTGVTKRFVLISLGEDASHEKHSLLDSSESEEWIVKCNDKGEEEPSPLS
jgi:hypothetical protein